jgi:hypothetical protein
MLWRRAASQALGDDETRQRGAFPFVPCNHGSCLRSREFVEAGRNRLPSRSTSGQTMAQPTRQPRLMRAASRDHMARAEAGFSRALLPSATIKNTCNHVITGIQDAVVLALGLRARVQTAYDRSATNASTNVQAASPTIQKDRIGFYYRNKMKLPVIKTSRERNRGVERERLEQSINRCNDPTCLPSPRP